MEEELIALKCPECGGKIEVSGEKAELFAEMGDGYIFIGSGRDEERIECTRCGTSFKRRQRGIQPFPSVVIQQGRVNVSLRGVHNSVVITTGGNLVIRR